MERRQRLLAPRGTRRRGGLVGLALAAMVAVACGDDGGSSGVDGDKSIEELSPDEAMDLCEWGQSQFDGDAFNRFTCYAAALAASSDPETCEEIAQACLDDAEPLEPGDGECVFGDPPDCSNDVSVAEIGACLRDTLDVLREAADIIACDIDPEDLEDLDPEPASCEIVAEMCPELYEDEEDEDASAGVRGIRGARAAGRLLDAPR